MNNKKEAPAKIANAPIIIEVTSIILIIFLFLASIPFFFTP
tara:strand:- start:631 stop:753 length:123 start_codon:yes stop_codon:yes gene_type:complete